MTPSAIRAVYVKSPGELAAEAIIRQLEARAGGRFHIFINTDSAYGMVRYEWRYDCPCGEVSGYQDSINMVEIEGVREDHVARYIKYKVDVALEMMRRHVRSEGNEPGF